jgi:hypothetical protein
MIQASPNKNTRPYLKVREWLKWKSTYLLSTSPKFTPQNCPPKIKQSPHILLNERSGYKTVCVI